MSKPNFIVDSDFPIIDGVGHPDKISFFNVKGGGSTNTTCLDPCLPTHVYPCSRSEYPVATTLYNCRQDPDLHQDATGFWQLHTTQCLNAVPVGDTNSSRGSDRVLLDRIEVSGTVYRPTGSWRDVTTVGEGGPFPEFPYHHPKCFVALVLDMQANGAVPPSSVVAETGAFTFGAGLNTAATNGIGAPPFVNVANVPPKRYRVLAFDVLDFEAPVSQAMISTVWNTEEITPPILQSTVEYALTQFSWTSVVKGFRFDVCLNDVLSCFSGPAAGDATIANVVDNALHIYAYNFNGHDLDGFNAGSNFNYLSINFMSRLFFSDFLSPTTFAPAGADGGVVLDEAPGLDLLADQSAVLAGLPALPDSPIRRPKKKTKASEGYYNYRPRVGAGMLFPDDPERAAMAAPGSRGSSKAPRRKSGRFDSYEKPYGDEFERPFRRGKY